LHFATREAASNEKALRVQIALCRSWRETAAPQGKPLVVSPPDLHLIRCHPETHLADTRLSHPKTLAFVKLEKVTPLSEQKHSSLLL